MHRPLESGSRPRDGDQRGLAGSFEYSGDRPARWRAAEGVWLQGYWCYDWYDEVIRVAAIDPTSHRIRLAAPHLYSLMQGNPSPRRYRALNVLEELDQPGEFVIDRPAGRLYLWPPGDLAGARVTLATLDAPVVALRGAAYITLQGFVVEAGLDNGIEVTIGTACELVGCEVRNLRRLGIRVTGGSKHRVESCDLHHTGQGGQDCFFIEKLRHEVDITKPPYTTRYPELVGYLDPLVGVPRVNHARLNLLVRCGEVSGGNWCLDPEANWSTNNDPGFIDGPKGDYRLRRDAPVFKRVAGFKSVPFGKMGLQRP
ncbi:MAG TPA: right-handed parallel beta-helix repeat-containing protein [Candidatus Paceibacterota bacterium]|nr:right-handed parallel beta-helix repeat-containing protein [Verrucomicrobiota bacterium]HRY51445.1 right-handed parallel beta-helix repeat-containing protein [Candidatus Paceibacterota bacterium]HRZ99492.1 right-handed parallel beta-helix repeat-containing protein [Candidatus Paceibacterota bacterium]